jgi:hypothetical protein
MTSSSAMPWIKLQTSRLDDSIFARLTDAQNWRYVQLELLAGKLDAGGCFVEHGQELSDQDIAWKLRLSPDALAPDLQALAAIGLVCKNGHGWYLPSFEDEQGPTQADKRAAWKDRQKKHREGHVVVTSDNIVTGVNVTPTESESESESDKEKESESESASRELARQPADAAELIQIFKALGASPKQIKYLEKTGEVIPVQPEDIWAMAARLWQDDKVRKPAWITMQNILSGEKASADWYDESRWVVIPAEIRRAGGLLTQSQENQEDQSLIMATRIMQKDETVTERVEQWWQSVQGQLQMEMPKASFDTWVRGTAPIHYEDGLLQICASTALARQWLEERLTSTAVRLLQGLANQTIQIQFVVREERLL